MTAPDAPTDAAPPPAAGDLVVDRPRRLRRSTDDRVVAGVAGGLGAYFGMDPVVFRVGFVVAALMGGTGIVAYLLAALALPHDDGRPSPLERAFGHGGGRLALYVVGGLVAVPIVVVLLALTVGGWFFPLIVVGLGVLIWLRMVDEPRSAPASEGPPPPPDPGRPAAPPPEGPRPPQSRLALLTLAATLIAAGIVGLLQRSDVIDIDIFDLAAGALVVVGAALVLSAWFGRARGLIVLGVVLSAVSLVGAATEIDLRGGFGEREHRPVRLDDVPEDGYQLAAGEMVVDLTALRLDGATAVVDIDIGAGEITVLVPDDADVVIDAHVSAGEIQVSEIDAERIGDEGIDVDVHRTFEVGNEAGEIILDVDAGLGSIEIDQQEPDPARDGPADDQEEG